MGIEAKIVEKSGAWLSYGDLRIGQGRENAKQFLKENPELANEIERSCARASASLPTEAAPTPPSRARRRRGGREREGEGPAISRRRQIARQTGKNL